jgi:hypothetical protein
MRPSRSSHEFIRTSVMAPKFKHWLYDNHWVVSFGLLLIVFVAWTSVDKLRSWSFLYPAVGAVLGLSYFALKQHLEETRLFQELFSAFNSRYDAMNERLYALFDAQQEEPLTAQETMFLYSYFNLCAEEFLYFRKGFIYPEVWIAWLNGMKIFYTDPRIRALWKKELETDSYYGFKAEFLEG